MNKFLLGFFMVAILAGIGFAQNHPVIINLEIVPSSDGYVPGELGVLFYEVTNPSSTTQRVLLEGYVRPIESRTTLSILQGPAGLLGESLCDDIKFTVSSTRIVINPGDTLQGYLFPRFPEHPFIWKDKLRSSPSGEYFAAAQLYTDCGGSALGTQFVTSQTVKLKSPGELLPDPTPDPEPGTPELQVKGEITAISTLDTSGVPGDVIRGTCTVENTGDVINTFLVEGYLRKQTPFLSLVIQDPISESFCVPGDNQFVSSAKIELNPGESKTFTMVPIMPQHPFIAGGRVRDGRTYRFQCAVYPGCGLTFSDVSGTSRTDTVIITDTSGETPGPGTGLVGLNTTLQSILGIGLALIIGTLFFMRFSWIGGIIGAILGFLLGVGIGGLV